MEGLRPQECDGHTCPKCCAHALQAWDRRYNAEMLTDQGNGEVVTSLSLSGRLG